SGQMPALMYELADRIGDVFSEQFRRAGYAENAAPIYAHALVGMVAFVGQWWTEGRKPPPADVVASHVAALGWMGLRHLPKKPALEAASQGRGDPELRGAGGGRSRAGRGLGAPDGRLSRTPLRRRARRTAELRVGPSAPTGGSASP